MNYLIDMWLILNDLIQVDSLINYHIISSTRLVGNSVHWEDKRNKLFFSH